MSGPDLPPPRHSRGGRVAGSSLRRRTSRAVRPTGPPTVGIPVWTGPDGVSRETALAVIDIAVRAGVALLSTGAGAADVVGTVLRLTSAYGLRSVHVDVTFSAVSVSYHRGPSAEPVTVLRVVRTRVQDFTRLERLRALVVELADHPVDLEEARVRFDSVIGARHPYRRWFVTAALGVLSAGVATLFDAGWLVILLSFVSSALVDLVQHRLGRIGGAAFFTQVVGSAIPTMVAILVSLVQRESGLLQGVLPSLVVASGIVVLLSGLSVVGAAQDAIEGFYVTAGARAFEVLVLTLGIVVGITVVLALTHRLGVAMTVTTDSPVEASGAVQVLASAVIAGAFAVSSYAGGLSAAVAALAGGSGWAVFLLLTGLDAGRPTASAVAAFLAGFTTQLVARRLRVPALAVTTASIVPLLPGRAVYQGIFEVVSDSSGPGLYQGLGTLLGAAGVGMGLAAGVSLGTYLGRLLQDHRSGRRRRGAPGAQGVQGAPL